MTKESSTKTVVVVFKDGSRRTGNVPRQFDEKDVISVCLDVHDWDNVKQVLFLL